MLNLKRLAALGMAAVMTMGLGMTSLAAPVTAANFTTAPGTAYTTLLDSENNYSAVLGVGPADSWYAFEGYSSAQDALDSTTGVWVNGSGSFVGDPVKGATHIDGKGYATTFTVTGTEGDHGAASLLASNVENPNAYLNLTVYQEAETTVAPAENVTVTVADVSGLNGTVQEKNGTVAVKAAKVTPDNRFYNVDGCAQSYPTAGDALYSLVGTGFEQSGGYVNSVTMKVYDAEEEDYVDKAIVPTSEGGYYGWNYCVIRDGAIVECSNVMSAAVLEVEKNDAVYWAYGTSTQAQDYFNSKLPQ